MMNIAFFWLPIVLAHTGPAAAPVEAIPAGPAWAQAVRERADAGWHMRDLESHHDGEGIEIAITLASEDSAERLSVHFQPDSDSFSDFGRQIVALPTEARQYQSEDSLFEELSLGAPLAVHNDCADFFLDFGSSTVALSPDDFSVALWSTDKRPGRQLNRWLTGALAQGQLVDLREQRADDGARVVSQVVFVVDSPEGVEEMTVDLSADGAPSFLSLEHSPGGSHWGDHPKSGALRRMTAASGLRRLRFVTDDPGQSPKLQIQGRGKASLELDLSAFAANEEECGC